MKKTFTLFTALLFSAVLFAQTRLSITSASKTTLRVMVDGKKYQLYNDAVQINNLRSGNHEVKIFHLAYDGGRSREGNYMGRYQLVYSKTIFVKPQYHVDIMINRFGKAFIDEQLISDNYGVDDDDDWGVDSRDQYYDRYSRKEMDKISFEQLKQSLKKESFDQTKLKTAKQFIAQNYFSTAQVKELVMLFSFDDSKLELAKFAYDYTIDKGNYFLMNDAFSFSSSKESLMDYIRDRK